MSRFNLFSKKLVDLASESRHASPESPSTHTNTNPTTNTNTNTNPTNPSKLGDNTMFNTVLMPILAKITRIASQRGGEIARPLASELRGFNATPPPEFSAVSRPEFIVDAISESGQNKINKLVDSIDESTHTSCESSESHPSTNPKPQEV